MPYPGSTDNGLGRAQDGGLHNTGLIRARIHQGGLAMPGKPAGRHLPVVRTSRSQAAQILISRSASTILLLISGMPDARAASIISLATLGGVGIKGHSFRALNLHLVVLRRKVARKLSVKRRGASRSLPRQRRRVVTPGGYPRRRGRGALNPAASCADSPPRRSPAAAKPGYERGGASERFQAGLQSRWEGPMRRDGSLISAHNT